MSTDCIIIIIIFVESPVNATRAATPNATFSAVHIPHSRPYGQCHIQYGTVVTSLYSVTIVTQSSPLFYVLTFSLVVQFIFYLMQKFTQIF